MRLVNRDFSHAAGLGTAITAVRVLSACFSGHTALSRFPTGPESFSLRLQELEFDASVVGCQLPVLGAAEIIARHIKRPAPNCQSARKTLSFSIAASRRLRSW